MYNYCYTSSITKIDSLFQKYSKSIKNLNKIIIVKLFNKQTNILQRAFTHELLHIRLCLLIDFLEIFLTPFKNSLHTITPLLLFLLHTFGLDTQGKNLIHFLLGITALNIAFIR